MSVKSVLLSLSAVVALAASPAYALPLIANGNFEQVSNGTNKQLASGTSTTATDRTTLVGWNSSNGNDGGYNFVLDNATVAANTGASIVGLKGYTASPNGGNVFASDSQYWPGTLSQAVSGLTVGTSYVLTFDYAMAQQNGFDGANYNNYWQVTFGNTVKATNLLTSTDGAFTGWKTATMTFTATGTSQLLSFLAKGDAPGAPPFMLLDSVSMQAAAVPEPSTWSLLLGGAGLLGLVVRRRRNGSRKA